MCLWAIKDGWFPSEKVLIRHPETDANFYLFNQSLTYISGVLTIVATAPAWIVIFGKNKSWVWMTTLIFIALGIPNNLVMGIPILIFWIKDNNKEYYGKLNNPNQRVDPTEYGGQF